MWIRTKTALLDVSRYESLIIEPIGGYWILMGVQAEMSTWLLTFGEPGLADRAMGKMQGVLERREAVADLRVEVADLTDAQKESVRTALKSAPEASE